MKIQKDAPAIWHEYQQGVQFNEQLDHYNTVEQNENFFIGRQWEGVQAKKLSKPQFNILKRVVNYFVSTIVSDDIAANIRPFLSEDAGESARFTKIVSAEFDRVFEMCGMRAKNRLALRNAAVHGDAAMYFFMDVDSGQDAPGRVDAEIIDTTDIMFANPYAGDIQKQRYVIISSRRDVEEVREEAIRNGVPEDVAARIEADANYTKQGGRSAPDNGRVTVLLKLWKENGTVHAVRVTKDCTVMPERDTEYMLYPVVFLVWEAVRNQYHGVAAISGEIPNQIFINKMYAYTMASLERNAFPKTVYDAKMLPDGISEDPTMAYGVYSGDVTKALFTQTGVHDVSNQIGQFIDKTIEYTRDTMGASDAALGNVRPDNTSAIIAVQKASAAPLEMQKMAFYQFVEDYVRIIMDLISVDYGVRKVSVTDENGKDGAASFDFSQLREMHLKVNVDIGGAAYWSEVTQMQTIDNLFKAGIITDKVIYLESLPDGVLTNKSALIENAKQEKAKMEQQAQLMAMGSAAPPSTSPGEVLRIDPARVMGQLSEEEQAQLAEHPEIVEQILSPRGQGG